MSKFRLILPLAILVILAACEGSKPGVSSAPAPTKKEEPATVAHTGREAFQKMYTAAHLWTPDARPYRLQSELFKDEIGKDGKAAIWRAGFASPAKRSLKAFVWSGAHSADAPSPGVSSGVEDTYSPNNSSTLVFDSGFLKVDSDKAYEVAQQHGGEKLMKANPKEPVTYLLEWNPQENKLIWHVIYGSSPAEAKLRVAVDATSGVFERVEK